MKLIFIFLFLLEINKCFSQICGINRNTVFAIRGTDCGGHCDERGKSVNCEQSTPVIGCFCKPGFYRNNRWDCVSDSECSKREDHEPFCGKNAVYHECGNLCKNSCENLHGRKCPNKSCDRGCFCNIGLWRNEKGKCVPRERCSKSAEPRSCGKNQIMIKCGNLCKNTCEGLIRQNCPEQKCEDGCFCDSGYWRNKKGECVTKNVCTKDLDFKLLSKFKNCGKNSIYAKCGNLCKNTCEGLIKRNCNKKSCDNGCFCEPGFWRNKKGVCVTADECKNDLKSKDQESDNCGKNSIYVKCGNMCKNQCKSLREKNCPQNSCDDGCFCPGGHWRNDQGICVTEDQCKYDSQPDPESCDKNQILARCGNLCKNTCEGLTKRNCPDSSCDTGCFCKAGLWKNNKGVCVTMNECKNDYKKLKHKNKRKKCARQNYQVYARCGNKCKNSCSGLIQNNCPQQSCDDGCFCEPGHYRNEEGICVRKSQCYKKEKEKKQATNKKKNKSKNKIKPIKNQSEDGLETTEVSEEETTQKSIKEIIRKLKKEITRKPKKELTRKPEEEITDRSGDETTQESEYETTKEPEEETTQMSEESGLEDDESATEWKGDKPFIYEEETTETSTEQISEKSTEITSDFTSDLMVETEEQTKSTEETEEIMNEEISGATNDQVITEEVSESTEPTESQTLINNELSTDVSTEQLTDQTSEMFNEETDTELWFFSTTDATKTSIMETMSAETIEQMIDVSTKQTDEEFAESTDQSTESTEESAEKTTQKSDELAENRSEMFNEEMDTEIWFFGSTTTIKPSTMETMSAETIEQMIDVSTKQTDEESAESADLSTESTEESAEQTIQTTEESAEKTIQTTGESADLSTETTEESAEKTIQTTGESADLSTETTEESAEKTIQTTGESADLSTETNEESIEKTTQKSDELAENRSEMFNEEMDTEIWFFGSTTTIKPSTMEPIVTTRGLASVKSPDQTTETNEESTELSTQTAEETKELTTQTIEESVEKTIQTTEKLAENTSEMFDEEKDTEIWFFGSTIATKPSTLEAIETISELASESIVEQIVSTTQIPDHSVEETTKQISEISEESTEQTTQTTEESTELSTETTEESKELPTETTEESTEQTTQTIEESTELSTETTEESTEQTTQTIEESTELSTETTEESTELSTETTEESTEQTTQTIEESTELSTETTEESTELSTETTEESTEQTTQTTEESTELSTETTEESTEQTTQTTEESTEQTTQTIEESTELSTETTEESTEQTIQTIEESTELSTETTEESTEQTTQTTEESTELSTETTEESTEQTTQTIEESTELSTETTEESTEQTTQTTEESTELSTETTEESTEQTTQTIEESTELSTETTEESTEQTTQTIEESTELSTETTEESTEQTTQTTEESTELSTETTEESTEQTTQTTEESTELSTETTEESTEQTTQTTEESTQLPDSEAIIEVTTYISTKTEGSTNLHIKETPNKCPLNEHFSNCGSKCSESCHMESGSKKTCAKCKPGCFCDEGLLKNEKGICIPKDQCVCKIPEQKCKGLNEQFFYCYNECGRTCADLDETSKKSCPTKCSRGCLCKIGFVRNETGVCVLPDKCGKIHKKCKFNEIYTDCGTVCGKSCEDFEKNITQTSCSTETCNIGCFCSQGFYKNHKGVCVSKEKCTTKKDGKSKAKEDCQPFEQYTECGNFCTENCETPKKSAKKCSFTCIKGCICKKGLKRNADGICIPEKRCKEKPKCAQNEEYNDCGTECGHQCADLTKKNIKCSTVCEKGCFCAKGFFRERNNTCVPKAKCNTEPLDCHESERYMKCGTRCGESCQDLKNPVPCPKQCDESCFCKKDLYRNLEGVCVTKAGCASESNEFSKPDCPSNEIFKDCGNKCEELCEDKSKCKKTKDCKRGCFCVKGYLRHKSGKCVKEDSCKSKEQCIQCDQNEYYTDCGTDCGNNCADIGNQIKCKTSCRKGCFCKHGFHKNDLGKCVTEEKCDDFIMPDIMLRKGFLYFSSIKSSSHKTKSVHTIYNRGSSRVKVVTETNDEFTVFTEMHTFKVTPLEVMSHLKKLFHKKSKSEDENSVED